MACGGVLQSGLVAVDSCEIRQLRYAAVVSFVGFFLAPSSERWRCWLVAAPVVSLVV